MALRKADSDLLVGDPILQRCCLHVWSFSEAHLHQPSEYQHLVCPEENRHFQWANWHSSCCGEIHSRAWNSGVRESHPQGKAQCQHWLFYYFLNNFSGAIENTLQIRAIQISSWSFRRLISRDGVVALLRFMARIITTDFWSSLGFPALMEGILCSLYISGWIDVSLDVCSVFRVLSWDIQRWFLVIVQIKMNKTMLQITSELFSNVINVLLPLILPQK